MTTSGFVTVTVLAEEVSTTAQKYALVVTGDFEESTGCPAVECTLCMQGTCEDGVCVCDDHWSGEFCDTEVRVVIVVMCSLCQQSNNNK